MCGTATNKKSSYFIDVLTSIYLFDFANSQGRMLITIFKPVFYIDVSLLGCYKAARSAYSQLQGFKLPASWRDKLDVAALIVRARAAVSDDSAARLECISCYRCASRLSVVSSSWKDVCNVCSQPIIRSFISFDQLPIVRNLHVSFSS